MKDFGAARSKFSICSVCGSFNHYTADHNLLNDAAPELLDAAKLAVSDHDIDCNCILCTAISKAERLT